MQTLLKIVLTSLVVIGCLDTSAKAAIYEGEFSGTFVNYDSIIHGSSEDYTSLPLEVRPTFHARFRVDTFRADCRTAEALPTSSRCGSWDLFSDLPPVATNYLFFDQIICPPLATHCAVGVIQGLVFGTGFELETKPTTGDPGYVKFLYGPDQFSFHMQNSCADEYDYSSSTPQELYNLYLSFTKNGGSIYLKSGCNFGDSLAIVFSTDPESIHVEVVSEPNPLGVVFFAAIGLCILGTSCRRFAAAGTQI